LLIYRICFIIFLANFNCTQNQNPKSYNDILQEVFHRKKELKVTYERADLDSRDSVITLTRNYLNDVITNKIFPYWYGTEWDFNGTTRVPKAGKIACGYFVTNVLTDLGFKIPRVKWAQSASEVFIKKLTNNKVKRYSNKSLSDLEKYLYKTGDGIYLVGLDMHVGFITVSNSELSFVHSNYYQPDIGVMKEKIDTKNPLSDSNYRVIGKLMSDEMILNWLFEKAYN